MKFYFLIISSVVIVYLIYKNNEGFDVKNCPDPLNVASITMNGKTKCYNAGTYDETIYNDNRGCTITTKPNVIVQLYNEYMPNDPIHVLSSQIKEDTNLYSTCYPKHINVIDNTKLIA